MAKVRRMTNMWLTEGQQSLHLTRSKCFLCKLFSVTSIFTILVDDHRPAWGAAVTCLRWLCATSLYRQHIKPLVGDDVADGIDFVAHRARVQPFDRHWTQISWSMSWSLCGGVALVTALLPQSCYWAMGRRTTTLSCWPVLLRPLKECQNCNLYACRYFAEGAAPYTVTDGQQTVIVQMVPWLVQQFFHIFHASNIFFQHTASLLCLKQWCKIFCCNGFVDVVTFSHNGAPVDQNQRWRYDSSSSLGGGIGIEDADYDWWLVSDASCRPLISSWQDFNRQRASRGLSEIAEPLVLAAVYPRPVCPSLAWIRPNNNNIFTCEVKGWPRSGVCQLTPMPRMAFFGLRA